MIKLTNILKDVLILEASSEDDTQQIIGWHLSNREIESFTDEPMWFFTRKELAGLTASGRNGKREKDTHLYKTKITGKFLSVEGFHELCKKLGLDKDAVEADLTFTPSRDEKFEIIKPFKPYCDGFWHWEYDPRHSGTSDSLLTSSGVESLLVFNPKKTAKIIKEVPYESKNQAEKRAEKRIDSLPQGKMFDDAKRIDGIFNKTSRQWSDVKAAFEKSKETAELEQVNVEDIHITQPNVQANIVKSKIKNIDKEPRINVVEFSDGRMVIYDGHHTLTAYWALGKTKIPVNLVLVKEA